MRGTKFMGLCIVHIYIVCDIFFIEVHGVLCHNQSLFLAEAKAEQQIVMIFTIVRIIDKM